MAETVYNVTISNTSPTLTYTPYVTDGANSGGWESKCPTYVANWRRDLWMCDPDSAHTTCSFKSSLQFSFEGVGVYLFGNTTNNIGYDIILDGTQSSGNPRPDLDLLYSAVGLEPGWHLVTLTVREPASSYNPGCVTFREAVVSAGTGFTGATVTKKVLDDGDPSITYYAPQGGKWDIWDTYPQSIGPNGSTAFHYSYWTNASATVTFQGNGVAVYGACRSYPSNTTYAVSMDGTAEVSYDGALNLYSTNGIQIAGNCLRYFKTGLDGSKDHTLVLRAEAGQIMVDWVEVFSASGGTPTDGSRAPGPTGDEPKLPSSHSNPKIRIIAGVIAGSVILALVFLTLFFYFRRRRRQRNQPLNVPSSSTQGMTQTRFSAMPLHVPPVMPPRPESPATLGTNPFAGGTNTSLASSGAALVSPGPSSLSTYSGSVSGLGWPESVVHRSNSYNSTASEDAHSNFRPAEFGSEASEFSWAGGSSTQAVEGVPSAGSIASGDHYKGARIEGTVSPALSAPSAGN